MKELEKTKNISVATVLAILVILIGLLTYKKPKHIYAESTQTALLNINKADYILTKTQLDANSLLIDVRTGFEYAKGFIDNAVNISLPDILLDENIEMIREAVNQGKTIVFYSSDINEALSAKMLIDQLGYAESKVLAVSLAYDQDRLIVEDVVIEKSPEDIQAFINQSVKEAVAKEKVMPKPVPKKVIPQKKKKKMPVEGGC